MGRGERVFNDSWLDKDTFPEFANWLRKADTYHGVCFKCDPEGRKPFTVRTMGISAVTVHSVGKKHLTAMTCKKIEFLSQKVRNDANYNCLAVLQTDKNLSNLNNGQCATNCSSTLDNFVTNDDVTRAEIMYTFCKIKKQASSRCFADLANCFPVMFFDSEIAKKFLIQKDKLGYGVH